MDAGPVEWQRVRESLRGAAHRAARLLRVVPDPEAPGTGEWSAAETAAHLTHSLAVNLNAVRGRGGDLPPHLSSSAGTVDSVADFNASNLDLDPERDLEALAARIEEPVA